MSTLTPKEINDVIAKNSTIIGTNGMTLVRDVEQLVLAKADQRIAELEAGMSTMAKNSLDIFNNQLRYIDELRAEIRALQPAPVSQPTLAAPPHSEQQEPHQFIHDFTIDLLTKLRKSMVTMGMSTDESMDAFSIHLEHHLYSLCRSIESLRQQPAPQPSQEQVPEHLREFVEEIAKGFTDTHPHTQDTFCSHCGVNLDEGVEHLPTCIMIRAKALLQSQPKQSTGSEG